MLFFFMNRIKQLLRQRLIENGWRDQIKAYCKGMNEKFFTNLN